MTHSEQLSDLITALAKARMAFPAIVRNCSATARGGREYQYADLSTIADATSGVLAEHGLVVVQGIEDGDTGQLCISTTLFHTSGQWMQCALSVPKPGSMQEVGAISTYIRRYQQSSLLNVSTEDDDDASSTVGATTEPKATLPASNGHTPAPELGSGEPPEHPTVAHLEALEQLVTVQCGADMEELNGRIRHTLGLRQDASTAKRLMVRVMTMEQFMTIFQHFTKVAEQLEKSKGQEATRADHSSKASASEPATPEAPPAVPSVATASSSAASDPTDAAERDRVRLRAEVASWNLRISDKEREHVIAHNPYSKARALLWKTRLDAPVATPIEAAAD